MNFSSRHAAGGLEPGDRADTGAAHCRSCGRDFALGDLIFLCSCGSAEVDVVAGRELRVLSVELVAEPCA